LAGSSIIHQDAQYYRRNLQIAAAVIIIIIIIIIISIAERGGESTSSIPHSLQEPQVRTEAYALTSAQPIVMVAVRLRGTYK
jgi:hypothetical protein